LSDVTPGGHRSTEWFRKRLSHPAQSVTLLDGEICLDRRQTVGELVSIVAAAWSAPGGTEKDAEAMLRVSHLTLGPPLAATVGGQDVKPVVTCPLPPTPHILRRLLSPHSPDDLLWFTCACGAKAWRGREGRDPPDGHECHSDDLTEEDMDGKPVRVGDRGNKSFWVIPPRTAINEVGYANPVFSTYLSTARGRTVDTVAGCAYLRRVAPKMGSNEHPYLLEGDEWSMADMAGSPSLGVIALRALDLPDDLRSKPTCAFVPLALHQGKPRNLDAILRVILHRSSTSMDTDVADMPARPTDGWAVDASMVFYPVPRDSGWLGLPTCLRRCELPPSSSGNVMRATVKDTRHFICGVSGDGPAVSDLRGTLRVQAASGIFGVLSRSTHAFRACRPQGFTAPVSLGKVVHPGKEHLTNEKFFIGAPETQLSNADVVRMLAALPAMSAADRKLTGVRYVSPLMRLDTMSPRLSWHVGWLHKIAYRVCKELIKLGTSSTLEDPLLQASRQDLALLVRRAKAVVRHPFLDVTLTDKFADKMDGMKLSETIDVYNVLPLVLPGLVPGDMDDLLLAAARVLRHLTSRDFWGHIDADDERKHRELMYVAVEDRAGLADNESVVEWLMRRHDASRAGVRSWLGRFNALVGSGMDVSIEDLERAPLAAPGGPYSVARRCEAYQALYYLGERLEGLVDRHPLLKSVWTNSLGDLVCNMHVLEEVWGPLFNYMEWPLEQLCGRYKRLAKGSTKAPGHSLVAKVTLGMAAKKMAAEHHCLPIVEAVLDGQTWGSPADDAPDTDMTWWVEGEAGLFRAVNSGHPYVYRHARGEWRLEHRPPRKRALHDWQEDVLGVVTEALGGALSGGGAGPGLGWRGTVAGASPTADDVAHAYLYHTFVSVDGARPPVQVDAKTWPRNEKKESCWVYTEGAGGQGGGVSVARVLAFPRLVRGAEHAAVAVVRRAKVLTSQQVRTRTGWAQGRVESLDRWGTRVAASAPFRKTSGVPAVVVPVDDISGPVMPMWDGEWLLSAPVHGTSRSWSGLAEGAKRAFGLL